MYAYVYVNVCVHVYVVLRANVRFLDQRQGFNSHMGSSHPTVPFQGRAIARCHPPCAKGFLHYRRGTPEFNKSGNQSQRFPCMFSSGHFIAFGLTFWVDFYVWRKVWLKVLFLFFLNECLIVSAPILEKTVISLLHCLCTTV